MQNNNKGVQKDYKGKGEKTTEKLKTIKKRPNNCKESDTTKNAAKANNEKKSG